MWVGRYICSFYRRDPNIQLKEMLKNEFFSKINLCQKKGKGEENKIGRRKIIKEEN